MSLEAQTDQTPNGAANVRFHLMLSVRPNIRSPNQFRTLSRVVRCARFSFASHTSCLSRTRMRELVYHQVLLGVCVSVCVWLVMFQTSENRQPRKMRTTLGRIIARWANIRKVKLQQVHRKWVDESFTHLFGALNCTWKEK